MRRPALAQLAREARGLTLEQVARMLRTSPDALHRLERGGGWSYLRAEKLARLYQVSIECFPGPGAGKRRCSVRVREGVR